MRKKIWRIMPPSTSTSHPKEIPNSRIQKNIQPPLACEKAVIVSSENYLYLFGGYGPAPQQLELYPVEPLFVLDPLSSWNQPRGWNANLYRYCVDTENWEWLRCRGHGPEPRAGKLNANF